MEAINPIISIVTVVFNGKLSIEDTILSVINQTYNNKEYIIIDGGSSDGTIDIITRYERDISYWVSEPDKGIYDAMNKAIEKSKGDYILFMNSGDKIHDTHTLESIFAIETEGDIIYGDTFLHDGEIRLAKSKNANKLKYGMPFCHQSVLVNSALLKNRRFNLKYTLASDYDFFLSLYSERKYKFKKLDIPISIYDNNGASMSLHAIKEQSIISSKYYPFSFSSGYHIFRLNYYTFTAYIKKKLPKTLVSGLIKFKKRLCASSR